ncbi:MAG: DMT family transporter [Rhodospirillales bacterium]|nr:MAG: DMT family transporter [Rhodospirillales bacterium]
MWGSSFLLVKVAVAAIPPASLVAGRLAIAAAVLIGVIIATGRRLRQSRRHWAFAIVMAAVGNAIPFWLIAWGQQAISSGLAGILMAAMPLVTLVLAHGFVEGERLTRARAAGFLIGFSGIVVLIGPDALLELGGHRSDLIAQLAVLGGAVCYAVNAIIARHRPQSGALEAATAVALMASVMMIPAALIVDAPLTLVPGPAAVASLLILAVVSTAVATVVYFKLVTEAGPSFLSLINYLIPVWAVALGIIILREEPTWSALAALTLVLVGIGLSEMSLKRHTGTRPQ